MEALCDCYELFFCVEKSVNYCLRSSKCGQKLTVDDLLAFCICITFHFS